MLRVLFCLIMATLFNSPAAANDIVWQALNSPEPHKIDYFAVNSQGTIFASCIDDRIGLSEIHRSSDQGKSWEEVSDKIGRGLKLRAFAEDSRRQMYLGTQSGLFVTSDGGDTWRELLANSDLPSYGYDVYTIGIDRDDIIYLGMRSYGSYRSLDQGQSWEGMNLGPADQWPQVAAFGFQSDGSIVASMLNDPNIYYSTDRGREWLPLVQLPDPFGKLSAHKPLCINSRDDIFIGRNFSGIYMSSDDGQSWTGRTPPEFKLAFVDDLLCNSRDHLFATIGEGKDRFLLRSTDEGRSWERAENGLAAARPGQLERDAAEFLYLLADGKLYRTQQTTVLAEDKSSIVSGRVFFDADDNCERAESEHGFPKRILRISPGPLYAWTDEDGYFSIRLQPDRYEISLTPFDGWRQICPDNKAGRQIAILEVGEDHRDYDFAMRPEDWYEELQVGLSGERAIPGETVRYCIQYRNSGTLPFRGRIVFRHDPLLHIESMSVAASAETATSLVWDIVDLPAFAKATIKLQLRLDRQAPAGMALCSSVEVDGSREPDLIARAERDEFCHLVLNSYDPNDISVRPEGDISVEDKELSYTIRFQNTGTAPARRVVVIDTLPKHLDVSSLIPGNVSHDYQLSGNGYNILRWTFDNINLPDSNANEAASHGFIKFHIRWNEDMPVGTKLPNKAAIYFDYNDPVITNEVVNTLVGEATSVASEAEAGIRLYPNPADEHLRIESAAALKGPVKLRDLTGRLVMSIEPQHSNHARLALSTLAAGQYYLHLSTATGNVVKMVTVRH